MCHAGKEIEKNIVCSGDRYIDLHWEADPVPKRLMRGIQSYKLTAELIVCLCIFLLAHQTK